LCVAQDILGNTTCHRDGRPLKEVFKYRYKTTKEEMDKQKALFDLGVWHAYLEKHHPGDLNSDGTHVSPEAFRSAAVAVRKFINSPRHCRDVPNGRLWSKLRWLVDTGILDAVCEDEQHM
jgi:hypothetical protein